MSGHIDLMRVPDLRHEEPILEFKGFFFFPSKKSKVMRYDLCSNAALAIVLSPSKEGDRCSSTLVLHAIQLSHLSCFHHLRDF